MKVIKKDGTIEQFDGQKIVNAVSKSAARAMIELDDTQYHEIVSKVTLRSSISQRAARFQFVPITRRLLPGVEICPLLLWREQCTTRATPRHRFMRN